jgi:2-polyprenyl-3-methyl-5-hydroxy-6-metoxy-1,4-benzoquinol methylase
LEPTRESSSFSSPTVAQRGQQGKKIIEVGSGSGLLSVALAKLGATRTLLDISALSLKNAVSNFVEAGLLQPTYYNEDALSSSVPSEMFDVVWNAGVLEHFFDDGKEKLSLEMLRMAKPGGMVIVMAPNAWCWQLQISKTLTKVLKMWKVGFQDNMSPRRLKRVCARIQVTNTTAYAFDVVHGWHWIPFRKRITKLTHLETLELHCKRSWMGVTCVLAIQKKNDERCQKA